MKIRLFILLVSLAYASDSKAQDAFSTSAAGIEISANAAGTMLNNYWELNPAIALFWGMPFYLGEIELRAAYIPFKSTEPDIPDITNFLTTLDWVLPVDITARLSIAGGGFIGSNFMYQPARGPLYRPESEFSAGFSAYLRYHITDSFSIRGGIRQTRVYTFHRLNLTYTGLGVQYHFDNPNWLKEFFR